MGSVIVFSIIIGKCQVCFYRSLRRLFFGHHIFYTQISRIVCINIDVHIINVGIGCDSVIGTRCFRHQIMEYPRFWKCRHIQFQFSVCLIDGLNLVGTLGCRAENSSTGCIGVEASGDSGINQISFVIGHLCAFRRAISIAHRK